MVGWNKKRRQRRKEIGNDEGKEGMRGANNENTETETGGEKEQRLGGGKVEGQGD
jgi:hypothetical protein